MEKSKPVLLAVWNGFKAPLFCAVVMFVSAIALLGLQAKKTAFDATYQLVNDSTLTASSDVRTMSVQKFSQAAQARIAGDEESKAPGVDSSKIVKKSVEEAANQNFKTPLELSTKLTEGILKQKGEKLKADHEALEKLPSDAEYDTLGASAIDELAKAEKDRKLDVAGFVKNAKADSPLAIALKESSIKSEGKTSVDVVESTVNEFYAKKKGERNKLVAAIEKKEIAFDRMIAGTNNELEVQLALHQTQKPNTLFSGAGAMPDPSFALILDEKKGLIGLYWLLRIALTGAVLFAFVYLVLIPLKHLFFWTASGEVLSEYAKKLLEVKASAVGPTAAKAAMVTVAAASIAGGAALFANAPSLTPDPAAIASAVNDDADKRKRPITTATPDKGKKNEGEPTTTPPDLDARMRTLESVMLELTNAVNGKVIPVPKLTTDPKLTQELAALNEFLGKPDSDVRPSVFSKLKYLEDERTNLKNEFENRFVGLEGLIGKKDAALGQESLFGFLKRVDDSVGRRTVSQLSDAAARNDRTIIESLRDLGRPGSTDNSTLFGRMNATQLAVDKTLNTSADIRREQLGSRGRNFFTQFRTLTSSERHRVSQAAVDEITRKMDATNPLRNKLAGLALLDRVYSADELRGALMPLKAGLWETWKSKILSATRVAGN